MHGPTRNTGEIEVTFSTSALLEKLEQHRLNQQFVFTRLSVDQAALVALEKAYQDNVYLLDLIQTLKNWSSDGTALLLTNNLNQLVYRWLNAFNHDVQIDQILSILKCFTLKSLARLSKTTQFHLFIHHLFIESLNQYHLIAFDYAVNYDENTQLPHSHQLRSQLNLLSTQQADTTALLSLQFQIDTNAFLLPKSTAQDLNKQLVQILEKNKGASHQLFFNGDYKFDLLLLKIQNLTQINLLIAKLFRAFEDVVFINQQSILVKPFIGYSYTNNSDLNAVDLIQHTKLALEHAINTRTPFCAYSEAIEKLMHEKLTIESKVLEAFDSNNLTLNLQPIVDLKNAKCVGAELLLRGFDRSGTSIPPNIIIEVLNNAGKGQLFTRWLINSACRYQHELQTNYDLDIYLAVNLRAEDLYDTELPALFSNALSIWSLDPKSIILEINEQGILEENDQTSTVINALSMLGFKFALDDFGTGLSSLARLRALPIDLLKIDQSFVKHIAILQEDYEIVQSIAMLAKSLNLEVIAEGVENQACLELLKQLDVDKVQGFFYAKALPYETFIEWAKARC